MAQAMAEKIERMENLSDSKDKVFSISIECSFEVSIENFHLSLYLCL